MKLFYVILLIIILPILSFSQSNYLPGYSINLKGDTLKGYIDYKEWNFNPTSFHFKNKKTDNDYLTLDTSKISYFEILNLESYQKYTGPISMDLTNVNSILNGRDSTIKVKTVFLKILQIGKNVNLYTYKDEVKSRFFISTNNSLPKELIYKIYFDDNNPDQNFGRTHVENTFRKQLMAFVDIADSDLKRVISFSDYNKASLLNVVSKLNNVQPLEFGKKAIEKSILTFYIGASLNRCLFKADGQYKKAGGGDHTSVGPKFVAGLNVHLMPNTNRFLARLELGVSKNRYNFSNPTRVYPYNNKINYRFDQLAISITPQLLYNFYNNISTKLYIGLGVPVFINYRYTNNKLLAEDGSEIIIDEPYSFRKQSSGYMIKSGFVFCKKFEVYSEYISSEIITRSDYFLISAGYLGLGLNYNF